MSPKPASPVSQAWYKWKALRLPWRKRFLVGLDLSGNTYWEFRDVRGVEGRWRRIVQYPSNTHYGDVKVSPAWHQWLRYTRKDPPSLEEQRNDVLRQERMKYLAAQADAKWEAKPRLVDMPTVATGQPQPTLRVGGDVTHNEELVGNRSQTEPQYEKRHQEEEQQTIQEAAQPGSRKETWRRMQEESRSRGPDPWKQAQRRGGPSEEWQPQGWNPSSATNKKP